ncbi:MAG TPA: hypothetical protein VGL71_04655 [Urbifossiella sp.]|jgi:hypothetical protein
MKRVFCLVALFALAGFLAGCGKSETKSTERGALPPEKVQKSGGAGSAPKVPPPPPLPGK